MKKLLALVLGIGLTTAAIVALAGCKQKEGERCQVNDDCEPPLLCAQATQTCEDSSNTGQLDANLVDAPIDATDSN